MSGAAVAAGWATYLYWLPCRGSMLNGTIAQWFSYRQEFTDACLRRMDSGAPFSYDVAEQIPWVREMSLIALALCSVAWLALVLGLWWSVKTKIVAALVSAPGVAMCALALVGSDGTASSAESNYLWFFGLQAVAVVVALVAIYGWQPEVRGYYFLRVLVVLWGATAFGPIQQAADFLIMSSWSTANWDVPPGTGVLTAATLVVSAVLTVFMTVQAPQLDDWTRDPVVTTAAAADPS